MSGVVRLYDVRSWAVLSRTGSSGNEVSLADSQYQMAFSNWKDMGGIQVDIKSDLGGPCRRYRSSCRGEGGGLRSEGDGIMGDLPKHPPQPLLPGLKWLSLLLLAA